MADGEVRGREIFEKLKENFWLIAGIIIATEAAVIVIFLWLGRGENFDLLNPLSKKERTGIFQQGQDRKRLVGFLPTWMIGKTKTYKGEITDLVFSGVEVKDDGGLKWDVQSKKINGDAYLNLKESVKNAGGKNLLSIKLFEDERLEKLLTDAAARNQLMTEVRDIVTTGNFDGVNVDFEYMGNPTRVLDEDFGELFDQMKQSGWKEVGVDVFANTIIKGDKERLDKLAKRVDLIIVMAYDFHRPGSDFAGAVAPMNAETGQRSVAEILQKVVEFGLEKEKVIMAYPLYGYEWETVDDKLGSAQAKGGYGRTVQIQESVGFTGVNFDEMAQSPWATWTEKKQMSSIKYQKIGRRTKKVVTYYTIDQWHQAYFENEKSLGIKIEAVKQAQLGGVGYWALGYEGKESDLIIDLTKSL